MWTGFYSYVSMSEWFNKCQTVLYQYKPAEAIECLQQLSLKKDLIWSSETLMLVMSDIERTQLDFWSQDEFTELLCLQNGSTEHRNNWDVMKSPVSTYNRPWQHIIKINNSVIPFLVLHNNQKKVFRTFKNKSHCNQLKTAWRKKEFWHLSILKT